MTWQKHGRGRVASIDVAGEDEGEPHNLENPGRDYTVCWIWEVDFGREHILGGPTYKAVDAFVDRGSKHFDTGAGSRALNQRLLAFLNHWQVAHLIGDSTGIGAGLMSWFESVLGEVMVTKFWFSRPAKAQLGNDLIALIETGRFQIYHDHDEHTTNTPAGAGFWEQVQQCLYEVMPEQLLEKGLRWAVPDTARYEPVNELGKPVRRPVHDDYLFGAALIAHLDRAYLEGHVILGAAESVVLPGRAGTEGLEQW